jgi:hypothetical protein
MNHLTQNTLKLAVATALAGTSLNAAAIIDFTGGTSSVAVYAKENPSGVSSLGASGTDLTLLLPNLSNSYTVGGSNYYNIKVNLLNGAKFGAATTPTLYCDIETSTGAALGLNQLTTPSVGGATFNYATFVVPTATTLAGGGTCHVTGISGVGAITLSGINTKQVSALVEYKNGATPATTGYNSNLVTFSTALKPVFTPRGNSGDKIVDVAEQTLKYADLTSTATLGAVFFGIATATAANSPRDASDGGAVSGLKPTIGGVALSGIPLTLTVTGAVIGGASKVTLDTTSGCGVAIASATISGQVATFSSTALSVADYQGGVTAPGNSSFVCVIHDGATTINSGKVTACLDFNSEGTTVNLQLPKCGSLREVKKNGKTFYGYVIPKSGGRDSARFRFYNKSTTPGNIRVTLYDQDGNMLGIQGAILAESAVFGPNQVFIADVDAIQTATGGSFASGRAHAVFDIELPDVEMFVTMKNTLDPASPSTNYSTEALSK